MTKKNSRKVVAVPPLYYMLTQASPLVVPPVTTAFISVLHNIVLSDQIWQQTVE
jgi:hypothetical protein